MFTDIELTLTKKTGLAMDERRRSDAKNYVSGG